MAYFIRYGYVPLSSESVPEAANIIGSAPWFGSEGTVVEPAIFELISRNLLEFAAPDELGNQHVIRVSPIPNTVSTSVNAVLSEIWRKTREDIQRRISLVENSGWTHTETNREAMKDAMQESPADSVIKLMAYHGRTWLPPTTGVLGFLLDLSERRNDLRFEILIVGKNAKGGVLEGATTDEHVRASAYGLSMLKGMQLPRSVLKRFDVRTYGVTDDESLLRGLIIQTREGVVVHCSVDVWLFGRDRGFWGNQINIDGGSSLALLLRNYFDSTFSKSWPQLAFPRQLVWVISNHWFSLGTLAFIPLGSAILGSLWEGFRVEAIISISIGSVIAGLADRVRK